MIPHNDYIGWAVHYVTRLMERGYTQAKADAEAYMGAAAPREPGWMISHGVLWVGDAQWDRLNKKHPGRFKFSEVLRVMEGVEPVQTSLVLEAA